MCAPTCVLGSPVAFPVQSDHLMNPALTTLLTIFSFVMCSPIPQIHSWLASVMLSSENSQVLLSSVSSSRASVVCCENGDVASLPGARRSSPCRLAHEVRATNLLPSWVSCVCSLLSHLTTFRTVFPFAVSAWSHGCCVSCWSSVLSPGLFRPSLRGACRASSGPASCTGGRGLELGALGHSLTTSRELRGPG